jgi:hypothetical protein
VVELDPDFKLTNHQVVPKNENVIGLPSGFEFLAPSTMAYVMKGYGYFDYAFSAEDKQRGRLFTSYVSYLRRKENGGKKGTSYVGTIIYDNGITTDKLPIATDADWYNVMPAKPGYIAITEYHRKQKTLEMRVEKINM